MQRFVLLLTSLPAVLAWLALLAVGTTGCKQESSDPCVRLYDKLSRCEDFKVHESMEEDRKAAFLKDCKDNFGRDGRLTKCLGMDGCASMMISCSNSQDNPSGEQVRKLFDESARQLGGN
jgi:hypothetical protein